jgi:hypothetical protein
MASFFASRLGRILYNAINDRLMVPCAAEVVRLSSLFSTAP